METETVKTQIPLPLEFSDTPDGMSDAILEYQGCPLVTVRGSNDMSCIEVEDEEKVTAECLQMALFVRRACNSHYEYLKCLAMIDECLSDGIPIEKDDPIHKVVKHLLTK